MSITSPGTICLPSPQHLTRAPMGPMRMFSAVQSGEVRYEYSLLSYLPMEPLRLWT